MRDPVAPAMAGAAGDRERAPVDRGPGLRRGDGSFGVGAARLAGMAGALLGWRADEFWASTPAELAVVLQAMRADDVPADASKTLALKEMFPDD